MLLFKPTAISWGTKKPLCPVAQNRTLLALVCMTSYHTCQDIRNSVQPNHFKIICFRHWSYKQAIWNPALWRRKYFALQQKRESRELQCVQNTGKVCRKTTQQGRQVAEENEEKGMKCIKHWGDWSKMFGDVS